VKKEMLLAPGELQQFQNHSSQMAALDFMVSVASNTFIPTYDGNMAKVVEGHRRFVYPHSERFAFSKILKTFLIRYLAGILGLKKPSYWIGKGL
jgi:hypothetical protein